MESQSRSSVFALFRNRCADTKVLPGLPFVDCDLWEPSVEDTQRATPVYQCGRSRDVGPPASRGSLEGDASSSGIRSKLKRHRIVDMKCRTIVVGCVLGGMAPSATPVLFRSMCRSSVTTYSVTAGNYPRPLLNSANSFDRDAVLALQLSAIVSSGNNSDFKRS